MKAPLISPSAELEKSGEAVEKKDEEKKACWIGRSFSFSSLKVYPIASAISLFFLVGCIGLAVGTYFQNSFCQWLGMPAFFSFGCLSQMALLIAGADHFAHQKEWERQKRLEEDSLKPNP